MRLPTHLSWVLELASCGWAHGLAQNCRNQYTCSQQASAALFGLFHPFRAARLYYDDYDDYGDLWRLMATMASHQTYRIVYHYYFPGAHTPKTLCGRGGGGGGGIGILAGPHHKREWAAINFGQKFMMDDVTSFFN